MDIRLSFPGAALTALLTLSIIGTYAPAVGAETPARSTDGHATHAEPGTHEDWCAEHEVPESLCTRCNPALIPAFKATRDWCAEHGLPESQCRICHPDLKIERPQKTGAK